MCGLASEETAKRSGPRGVTGHYSARNNEESLHSVFLEGTPEVTVHPQSAVKGRFTPQLVLASLLPPATCGLRHRVEHAHSHTELSSNAAGSKKTPNRR